FHGEYGIRAYHVTGVQTCALPICRRGDAWHASRSGTGTPGRAPTGVARRRTGRGAAAAAPPGPPPAAAAGTARTTRAARPSRARARKSVVEGTRVRCIVHEFQWLG